MFQAPLPTAMPDSVASYCASSRPCAKPARGEASTNASTDSANTTPDSNPGAGTSRGEIMPDVATWGRSCLARVRNVIEAKTPGKQRVFRRKAALVLRAEYNAADTAAPALPKMCRGIRRLYDV